MPRKVYRGVDYDDDYDAYEDYEYDYDDEAYEAEENGITPDTKAKRETVRTGVWRCPICTYDNEDTMSACEICGVLRNPLVKISSNSNPVAVGGTCKEFGVSVMAKSLFASLLHPPPENSVLFKPQNELGNDHGNFHEFNKLFSGQNHHKVNIAPFKFDAPSPDDLVSNGVRSMKLNSKANFNKPSLDNAPTEETNIKIESYFDARGSESTSSSASQEIHNGLKEKKSVLESMNKPKAFDAVPISSKSERKAKISNEERAESISQYKPEAWMTPNKEDDRLNQLNLAIVGHVDSGKSTLSGRMLHLLGRISKKEMHKNEKEAKEQGKGSFAYAWALDESAEERERGITMTVAVAFFTSKKYHVVILDSPGHRDFVPNMISGATQADAAILVVDASIGSFEAGIGVNSGQTREHAQLIRSFGVDQIIVLVNKLDVVEYSKERFDVIKEKLGTCLRSCGFKDSSVLWIPASAMENQNLIQNPSDVRFSWFKGPHLLEAIDSLQLPSRDYSKPLLMPVCDFVKLQSQGHVSACGKLERGAIRAGSKVLVMPSKVTATIRAMERDSEVCNIARAGDNVTVTLQGIEANRVTAGGVICHPDYPVQVSNHLELKILVLDISTPILIGSQLEFHIHHAKEAATVVKISSILDSKTGKATKKSPRCLLSKQNAIIEVVLQGSVCVEEYSDCRALGRVSLRASGKTIALGVVTKIMKSEE
ncbi:hypothetical protein ACJIZ3_009502 [Penstemon smallii]|uniref:Uncharacterized protein n=1 Tax=Penstemon smallii TaxID=265156 RepID=A0ABD3TDS3_9LAMI